MRGEPSIYNHRTGKFQKQPKNMRVGTISVKKSIDNIVINRGVVPFYERVTVVTANVHVNGKLICVRANTYRNRYANWDVEVFKTDAKKVVFGLEKATAIRAAKTAWAQRFNVRQNA